MLARILNSAKFMIAPLAISEMMHTRFPFRRAICGDAAPAFALPQKSVKDAVQLRDSKSALTRSISAVLPFAPVPRRNAKYSAYDR